MVLKQEKTTRFIKRLVHHPIRTSPLNKLGLQMRITSTLFGLIATWASFPVSAQDGLEIIGKPVDGRMSFQPAATGLMENLQSLDLAMFLDHLDQ